MAAADGYSRSGVALGVALIGLILLALSLLGGATENSAEFGRLYSSLLIVNLLALVGLGVLIAANVRRLVRDYRAQIIGSRLALRLVAAFVLLAVVPASTVYYFSVQFLRRGIDSWFDVRIETALADALELSRGALDLRFRELMRQTEAMGRRLGGTPRALAGPVLNELREAGDVGELTLLAAGGRVIASSTQLGAAIVPNLPDDVILQQVRRGGTYVGLDPVREQGLFIRVVAPIPADGPLAEPYVLQALFPVSKRIDTLVESVNDAFAHYKELLYLRGPLKTSFTLTLSLVLLLSLLTAVWVAFLSARRLVAPIGVLASGTRLVAAGNYDQRLPETSPDELGALVRSFNEMTEKIAQARDEVQRSREQAERERAYLRAVLGGLSSGVLTLDTHHILRSANAAAKQILGADLERCLGRRLEQLGVDFPHLEPLVGAVRPHLRSAGPDWREEVSIFGEGGRKLLICRGTCLPGAAVAGSVVVFDDVTALLQAQRNAAWAEVARRLAHEIKNPLTPIQLSAERLRRKYLERLPPEEGELLDRCTHTIVQQVKAMEEMVRAFSEYARSPTLQFAALDVNALINEVLDLYRDEEHVVALQLELEPQLATLEADAGRLRQLLHNLIKNALEALEETPAPRLIISTAQREMGTGTAVELRIHNNGPAIPAEIMDRLFEPYVTTKPKGTGLGLAIVKKIVEEHSGIVWAANPPEGGAEVVIRLPARAEQENQ